MSPVLHHGQVLGCPLNSGYRSKQWPVWTNIIFKIFNLLIVKKMCMCVLFFKPVFMKCNTNVMLLDATQTSLPSLILDNENIVDTNFWGGSDTSTEMKYGTYLKKKKSAISFFEEFNERCHLHGLYVSASSFVAITYQLRDQATWTFVWSWVIKHAYRFLCEVLFISYLTHW